MPSVKFKRLHPRAIIPKFQTDGAMCFDLHAVIDNKERTETVSSFHPAGVLFKTGWAVEFPAGFAGRIHSRSGHGIKNGICLANSTGMIDNDYRGELMVKLISLNPNNALTVKDGERIAQMEIVPYFQPELIEVDELAETLRGTGGLGSTGQ